MSLLRWFSKKKPKASLGLKLGYVRSVAQWKADDQAVSWLANVLSDQRGQELLSILRDNSPVQTGGLPGGVSDGDVARAYGAICGWNAAIKTLLNLAETEQQETIEQDYQSEI